MAERRKIAPLFTLYRYGPHHWAIDCELCDRKIADLKPSITTGEITDKIDRHQTRNHPYDPS